MAQPAKWTTFLKRNIRQARANNNGNYAAALAEVSAGWRVAKAQRTQAQANALQELARSQAEALQEAARNRPEAIEAARLQAEADQEAARVQEEADQEAARIQEEADQRAAQRQENNRRLAELTQTRNAQNAEQAQAIAERAQAIDNDLMGREGDDEVMPTADELRGDTLWKGGLAIGGRGGVNDVSVWVRLDPAGLVRDRAVVKRTTVEKLADWKDGTKWSGDIRDVQNRQNMDYVLHKRLCDVPNGGANFAKLRGYRNFPEDHQYRVIGEYYDADNLEVMMNKYHNEFRHEDTIAPIRKAKVLPAGTPIVPEPVVWRMLEQLLKAVLVMEQGSLDGPVEGWQQVVHRDLKPDNVFLATTTDSIYPNVKLSDFEFAVETSTTDGFNPQVLRRDDAGNACWRPMELRTDDQQKAILDKEKEDTGQEYRSLIDEQILAAANLWGVGAIIYELMHSDVSFERPYYTKPNDPMWVKWNPSIENSYSTALVDIVKTCLMHEPAQRGTAREKLDIVDRAIDDDEKADRLRLARDGAAADEDGPHAAFKYPEPDERYAMGAEYFKAEREAKSARDQAEKNRQSTAELAALTKKYMPPAAQE
ncbi:unnamed protein product [Zymoseptoria tritici ST99CH_1A5]|uniref:non-specific serine/threonine protein kinase n=1 Tax=Zymoseptoria tritici ST99CH_1A5 TaxID=1276529 RepID=A0A1Y6LHX4_ZYMTR|nr:unnamed protein product [Zymoseptoria tritici ST99CH_1A5]